MKRHKSKKKNIRRTVLLLGLLLLAAGLVALLKSQSTATARPHAPAMAMMHENPPSPDVESAQQHFSTRATTEQQAQTPPPPTSSTPNGPVICIDAGHPSEVNYGNTVQNGARETEVNWRIAQQLTTLLKERGIIVVTTKNSCQEFVTNRKRAEIANAASAVLLLRLHCDTGRGSGYTLYYPNRQGKTHGVTGPSPDVIAGSRQAADLLHAGMADILGSSLPDNGIKGEDATHVGRKQGALTGSIFSHIPTVTVEMVYLSHPADARFITSNDGVGKMAAALFRGVLRYLEATCSNAW